MASTPIRIYDHMIKSKADNQKAWWDNLPLLRYKDWRMIETPWSIIYPDHLRLTMHTWQHIIGSGPADLSGPSDICAMCHNMIGPLVWGGCWCHHKWHGCHMSISDKLAVWPCHHDCQAITHCIYMLSRLPPLRQGFIGEAEPHKTSPSDIMLQKRHYDHMITVGLH